MSDATDDAMTVTMDKSGRLVLPKAIREEAGIRPGRPMEIRVRGGRIEIDPGYAKYRLVKKHGFTVAEALEPIQPMTRAELRKWIHDIRDRRIDG